MLIQVLNLTPDQINALPPSERDAIQQLVGTFLFHPNIYSKSNQQRNQFMSGITV
jgi:hypothetical protein